MTKNVVVANENNTFSQLMEFFTKHNIQHLPVTSGEEIVGIISARDMTRYLNDKLNSGKALSNSMLNNTFRLTEVMTANPISVDPDDSIEKVTGLLAKGKFQAVPVVKNRMIHGIITNKDIVKMYNWELGN